MRARDISCALFLGLICATSRGVGPDYLFNDYPYPDRASEILTPYPDLEEEEPTPGLFKSVKEPFIRDISFSLEPRLYFRSLENTTGVNSMFAGGGALGITTGWWLDTVQLGATGYSSIPLATNQDDIDRTGLVEAGGDGFAVLGQAWGKLRFGPATITLFRQELELPFIHGDDSRMVPNTFEAYQLEIEKEDIFRFNLGYVAKIKPRNSAVFIPMSEAAGIEEFDRGTGFVGFVLGSEERTYFEAITEVTFDLFNCTYVQTGHTWKVTTEFELRGDIQFADQRSVGEALLDDFNTQFYGAQLVASYKGAIFSLAYNHTAKGASIIDPYGADPSFTGLMVSNFVSAGEDAYLVGLSYNFERLGLPDLTAFSNYVYGELPKNQWEHEFNATVDYEISKGPLKNLWLRLRYAFFETSERLQVNDFRVILNYSYEF